MMKSFGVVMFLTVASLFQQDGEAYSSGSPFSTCWTLYPKHSHLGTQETECPFKFTFTPSQFQPGDEVTIDIAEPNGRIFKGIELGAHRVEDNTEVFVGQFVDFPVNKIKVFNCFTGFHNMITHKTNDTISSLKVKWRAPNKFLGDVKFRGSLVADYETFWVNVEYVLKAAPNSGLPSPSEYPAIETFDLVNDIDFSDCGDTKGCFFYPRHCDGDDCVAAATYEYRSATDDYLVELHTSEGPNYISLGLSHDEKMGNDATVTCASSPGFMSIQEGWNPAYYNERQLTRDISALEVRQKDGHNVCRFVMPAEIQVYHMIQDSLTFDYTTQLYNTEDKWYLMLAWGKTMPESDVITYHDNMPVTSFSKVDIKSHSLTYGSAYHILVRVHVAMMVIAWVLFTGIVTVISRHYRDWLPKTTLFGTKVWFQVHRGLAVMVVIFTGIGLAVIFAHYGAEIREKAIPHAYVGLAVTGCVGMQLIAGILRPGNDHDLRPIFNWGHRFLGQASHILAAATMFLAFDIDYVTPTMRKFGFITLSVWVTGQVLWHIIFEILSCRNSNSANSDSYDLDSKNVHEEGSKPSKFGTLILCVYITCLVALCVAVMISFLLF